MDQNLALIPCSDVVLLRRYSPILPVFLMQKAFRLEQSDLAVPALVRVPYPDIPKQ
ncbi:hypothetical protein [Leptolyngbya sp. AS-A5]|uniref:hypothetical protein n=1 Tax=Leptolyngbya sp. AS-A5 TaxID=2933919 RepID=UPI0032994E29